MTTLIQRAAVLTGTVLATTALTVTTAAAAGPPMPDFRGKALMDVFQTVDYRTRVDIRDVSGFNRNIFWPLNWKVCSQTPAPGVELEGQALNIGVVKKTETCPKAAPKKK
ncbi:hypothetical protein [Streptomyces mesophilus]|uniref:hypothetical protein n=1 Tax=Streptomyces mesophilus TaxID=1775132 RepID=UPI0019D1E503|nr:hypothetical protein [Streptomyces mesophilus]